MSRKDDRYHVVCCSNYRVCIVAKGEYTGEKLYVLKRERKCFIVFYRVLYHLYIIIYI